MSVIAETERVPLSVPQVHSIPETAIVKEFIKDIVKDRLSTGAVVST